jgi:hypothetical protein
MPRKNRPADTHIIKPLEEAVGPVTPLREITERWGIDTVVRAIAGGLTVYDAGRVLMVNEGTFTLLTEISAMEAA